MKVADVALTPTIPLAPTLPPAAVAERAATRSGLGQVLTDYSMLIKPRLTLMVLFTVAIGFVAATGTHIEAGLLLNAVFGVGLVAAGASALNQLLERETDKLMVRTRNRPLPAGRLQPATVLRFGVLTACAGLLYLVVAVNALTAFLAMATLVIYVLAYTPLKRRTTFNTLVGAVPGALPPVMGWTAATGEIGSGAIALFLILFVWQFPHFWAIAWLYRHDYSRAGLQMVPVKDTDDGRMTGRLMVQNCLVLLPVSLLPAVIGLAGPCYAFGALALGGMFLWFALRFLRTPSHQRARRVLWASLVFLPLILTLLLLDGPLLIL